MREHQRIKTEGLLEERDDVCAVTFLFVFEILFHFKLDLEFCQQIHFMSKLMNADSPYNIKHMVLDF